MRSTVTAVRISFRYVDRVEGRDNMPEIDERRMQIKQAKRSAPAVRKPIKCAE